MAGAFLVGAVLALGALGFVLSKGSQHLVIRHMGSETNQIGTPHTVEAFAYRANQRPLAGVSVEFLLNGLSVGSGVTDALGLVQFTWGSSAVGVEIVQAKSGVILSNTLQKVWTATPPPPPPPVPTMVNIAHVGPSTNEVNVPHTVEVTVFDQNSQRMPNVPVTLFINGAQAGSGVTAADGTEQFTYTSAQAQTDRAYARAGTVQSATITKVWTSPSPPPGTIWRPALVTPWHWMIDHELDLNNSKDMGLVDPNGNTLSTPAPVMYDIDAFLNTAETVAALRVMGKKVVAYIDVGVYEDYRPDAYRFPLEVIGNPDQGWAGSWWLDIRRLDVLIPIMRDRFQMAKDKGFDAIEPDEIDGYANDSGFPLTYADQLRYNRAIADLAHSMGLSIGLKGDIEQARDLEPWFDWTLNEECFQYRECDYYDLSVFTRADKAVFQVEYKGQTANFCPTANARNWNSMKMPLNLNGGRWPCR